MSQFPLARWNEKSKQSVLNNKYTKNENCVPRQRRKEKSCSNKMDSLSGIGFKVFIIKPLANAETLAHLPGVHTKKTPKTSIIGITSGTTKTHLSWVYSVFCVYFVCWAEMFFLSCLDVLLCAVYCISFWISVGVCGVSGYCRSSMALLLNPYFWSSLGGKQLTSKSAEALLCTTRKALVRQSSLSFTSVLAELQRAFLAANCCSTRTVQ